MMQFFVPGVPVAQGSKRHVGRGIMVEQLKNLGPWRDSVINAAHNAPEQEVFFTEVAVEILFVFPRPKNHFGTGRNAEILKASAPKWKASSPDIDKLCRAVLDAVTMAGILRDDALVAALTATKSYGEIPGAAVSIRPLA